MALISVNALQTLRQDGRVRIVDARYVLADSEAGRKAYVAAHIPDARYLSLHSDLSGPKSNPLLGRHPLPSLQVFSASLQRIGISPNSPVVIYDQSDSAMAAARAWFLLFLAGHAEVYVLDGGFDAWCAEGLPVQSGEQRVEVTGYPLAFAQERILTTEALKTALASPAAAVLLDARAPERFRGEIEPIDAKAGHIPGAINRPYTENLQGGLFKSASQLAAEFKRLDPKDAGFILSCGSGVTACHHALALSHAGMLHWRLYAPSWSGWIADDMNAVAVGN
jgi:thiosulfate/3-mercaptopyruvate sulfurtransferase